MTGLLEEETISISFDNLPQSNSQDEEDDETINLRRIERLQRLSPSPTHSIEIFQENDDPKYSPAHSNGAKIAASNSSERSSHSKITSKFLLDYVNSKWLSLEAKAGYTIIVLLPILIWAAAFLIFGDVALPGRPLFAVLWLEIAGLLLGRAFEVCKLPPLLGMLAVGIICRNVSYFVPFVIVDAQVSSVLRQIALVVILIRAGLGLDPVALVKLKGVVIRLAFLPCLVEASVVAVMTKLVLGWSWSWGFLLGFVLAAVSPAVVVPCLLALRDQGYGVDKGIPTVVIAASSVDDILAISCFGIALGLAVASDGRSLLESVFQAPLEVLIGLVLGVVGGIVVAVPFSQAKKDWTYVTFLRTVLLLLLGIFALFGTQYIEYPGAGALATLLLTLVAALIWRWKGVLQDNDDLNGNFSLLWFIFQPLLFSLIGLEIDLVAVDGKIVGLGLFCVFIALAARVATSYFVVYGADLSVSERLFIAVSWLPKATVQAAIGPVALDTARKLGAGIEAQRLGLEVLTLAVLVILITAPVGATAIMLLGPRLLSKSASKNGATQVTSAGSTAGAGAAPNQTEMSSKSI